MLTLLQDNIRYNMDTNTPVSSLFKLCPDLDLTELGFGAVGGGRALSEPERECRIPSSDASATTSKVIRDVMKLVKIRIH